jgi:hypothetical protein
MVADNVKYEEDIKDERRYELGYVLHGFPWRDEMN